MEKLILRGVMWGADKVPDDWFDKIPGGYYKAKEKQVEQELEHEKEKNAAMKKRRTRRYSDDEYDEDDRDSRDGGRDDRDAGYRSDGHQAGRSAARKSHDGADDNFDEINNRPRRKRSKGRRADDNDKYGKDDGHRRSSRRSRQNGVEYGDGAVPPTEQPPSPVTYTDPMVGAAAMGGAAAAANAFQQNGAYGSPRPSNGAYGSPPPMTGAYGSPQPSTGAYGSPQPFHTQPNVPGSINSFMQGQPPARSTSTLRGGMSTGYVPYAHIYGGPTHPSGYPPPQSDIGSVQPNHMNQVAVPSVAPPPAQYQQNPYAREAVPGTQPGYMPNPYPQQDGHHSERGRGSYESDDTTRDSRLHRRRSRRSRRDRTPSEDSYSDDSRDERDRQRRSRPVQREKAAPPAAPQSKSTVSSTFDTSQRGLGYSAVGALAGGLIGSELTKGTMSRALATAVGAIAANAFQARERRKEEVREKEYHRRKAGYYSD